MMIVEKDVDEYSLLDDLIDQVHCLPPILLVGRSGSGKTTFIEKMIKAYEPDRIYRICAPIRIQYMNSKLRFITELNRMFLNQTSLKIFVFVKNCNLLSSLVQKEIAHRLQFISNMVKFVGECSSCGIDDPKGLHPSMVDVCQRVNFHSPIIMPIADTDNRNLNEMLWEKSDKNHHVYEALKQICVRHNMNDYHYWKRILPNNAINGPLVEIMNDILNMVIIDTCCSFSDYIRFVHGQLLETQYMLEEVCSALIYAISNYDKGDKSQQYKLMKCTTETYMDYRECGVGGIIKLKMLNLFQKIYRC